jgi:hypothetical protein
MSPTLIKIGNLRIAIYPDDHGQAHVHVVGPGAEAKILIGSWAVVRCHGISSKTMRRVIEKLRAEEELLLKTWEEIHGEIEEA